MKEEETICYVKTWEENSSREERGGGPMAMYATCFVTNIYEDYNSSLLKTSNI